jgi:hypothetical protein
MAHEQPCGENSLEGNVRDVPEPLFDARRYGCDGGDSGRAPGTPPAALMHQITHQTLLFMNKLFVHFVLLLSTHCLYHH